MVNSLNFNSISWCLAFREHFLFMWNRILHIGIHTLQILLASCFLFTTTSLHYTWFVPLICSINHFPLLLLLFRGSFQTFSNLSIPLWHWSAKPKIVFYVFFPNRSGLGWASGWQLVGSSIIIMKKNPGNQTFRIYLDSFTRHIIFLLCFFRLFHRNATWVALLSLWGWVPLECHTREDSGNHQWTEQACH